MQTERESAQFSATCLTSVIELQGIEAEWRDLFDEVDDALPFASFDWVLAWWKHLRRDTRWIKDSLRLFAVRNQSGKLVAIAPMMQTSAHFFGIPVLRVLQFMGTDGNLTEVRGMLVSSSDEPAAVHAIASALAGRTDHAWTVWCGLRESESGADYLRRFYPDVALEKDTSAFVLTLPASWEELRARLPRNIRESLRKCYNSLSRDGHEWTFEAVTSRADLHAALSKLVDMHGRRASLPGTVKHRDCFATEADRAFIGEVLDRFANRGRVCVFQLRIAGEVVAARLGFLWENRMYMYYSGYDPEWGKYSVMTTVVAEAIKYAIANGMSLVNLSTGADESKLRWRPEELHYLDFVCVRPSRFARLRYNLMKPDRRRALKRVLRRD